MSRFVRPEVERLPLKSNGDWIEVKRRLTAGDQRARFARMSEAGIDGALHAKPLEVGMSTITAFLVDWSLTDDDGKKVEIRGLSTEQLARTLDALDPDSFAEILAAIDAHEDAQTVAREAEKKTEPMTGAGVTSPSPSDAAGASTGSATLTKTTTTA